MAPTASLQLDGVRPDMELRFFQITEPLANAVRREKSRVLIRSGSLHDISSLLKSATSGVFKHTQRPH